MKLICLRIRLPASQRKPCASPTDFIYLNASAFFLFWIGLTFFQTLAFASASVLKISEVSAERESPSIHWIHASLENTATESMETTLRFRLAFYDRNSPEGDIPVNVLRKDQTIVLKPNEIRKMDVKFLEEGASPLIPVRIEPTVRIRREREWKY